MTLSLLSLCLVGSFAQDAQEGLDWAQHSLSPDPALVFKGPRLEGVNTWQLWQPGQTQASRLLTSDMAVDFLARVDDSTFVVMDWATDCLRWIDLATQESKVLSDGDEVELCGQSGEHAWFLASPASKSGPSARLMTVSTGSRIRTHDALVARVFGVREDRALVEIEKQVHWIDANGVRTALPVTTQDLSPTGSAISPDGRWLALASQYESQLEIRELEAPFTQRSLSVDVSVSGVSSFSPRLKFVWSESGTLRFSETVYPEGGERGLDGRFQFVEFDPELGERMHEIHYGADSLGLEHQEPPRTGELEPQPTPGPSAHTVTWKDGSLALEDSERLFRSRVSPSGNLRCVFLPERQGVWALDEEQQTVERISELALGSFAEPVWFELPTSR